MNKYHNKKVTVDGITFDSKKEARRWMELSLLEKAGAISDLERQYKYSLIPSQRDPKTGKIIERECAYYADFRYCENGEIVVEDTKGFKTPDYIIKRKMMLCLFGIRIREV